jgi:hypothetical protein
VDVAYHAQAHEYLVVWQQQVKVSAVPGKANPNLLKGKVVHEQSRV